MNNDTGKISILIADDHPLFRSGVRAEMENSGKYCVIAEAEDGLRAFDLIVKLLPDIAILDFQMPGLNGIEIVEKLKLLGNSTKVILLTMHNEKKIFMKALEVGVNGYVLKNDALFDIVSAADSVFSGNVFISPKLSGLIVEKYERSLFKDENLELINKLSHTEKKILFLISELRSNDEIADDLYISKRTVENQKGIISRKLTLEKTKDLLKFSINYRDYLKPG